MVVRLDLVVMQHRLSPRSGGRVLAQRAGLARRLALVLPLSLALFVSLGARGPERADVFLDVDLDRFVMHVVADGVRGPSFRVATGTPMHPTPTGAFELERWIGNPSYTPGPVARERGASATGPSRSGPLGYAKIPFWESFQVHGGASRYAVGLPVTLGCVQLKNADMQQLESWLAARDALEWRGATARGEMLHAFARPTVLHIR